MFVDVPVVAEEVTNLLVVKGIIQENPPNTCVYC